MVLIMALVPDLKAGEIYNNAGTTGADFLKIVPSPRAAALGESFTAVDNDLAGLYYNPAALASIKNYRATFAHNIWFEDIAYDFAGGTYLTEYGVFGLQARYLYLTESIPGTTLDQKSMKPMLTGEELTASDLLAGLSYSRSFKGGLISAGANLNYISRKLASYGANAFSSDLGFLWSPPYMDNMWTGGLSVLNLGTSLNFGNSNEPLPFTVRAGIAGSYDINSVHGLLFSLDTAKPADSKLRLSLGAEYNFNDMLFARTGYKIVGDGLDTLSAGGGFQMKGIRLDYSWVPYGDYFSNTHRIAITFPIGEKEKGNLYGSVKPQKEPYSPLVGEEIFITDFNSKEGIDLASWEVWIEDKDANLIHSWDGDEKNFPDRVVWNGKDYSNNATQTGQYYYFMRLVGKGDEVFFTPGKKLLVDRDAPQMTVDTKEDTFNPRDGELKFNISGGDKHSKIVSWKLDIAFKSGNKLAKVIEGKSKLPGNIKWDGQDDYYREMVPDGDYSYRLYATDAAGNEGKTNLGNFTVKVPPKVKVKKIKVETTEKGLKINLASKVLFGSGKSKLKAESREVMENVAKVLDAYPENKVLFEGYTDSVGSAAYNKKLSQERAQTVADTLTNDYGINSDRFTVIGHGETQPVATNKTKEGRAKNRRVGITVLKAR